MTLWDKLRRKNKSERAFWQVERDVARTIGPLESLGLCIVGAADKCSRIVTGRRDSTVASTADMFVFYEFLYFFLHLTMREAFDLRLEPAKLEKLRGYLGPLMAATAVDTFCGHWPEDRKSKLRSDFFGALNEAEIEYAKCEPMLMSKDAPLTGNTLLAKLVRDVAEAAGHPHNPETMIVALSAAVDAIGEARLSERVADAGEVL